MSRKVEPEHNSEQLTFLVLARKHWGDWRRDPLTKTGAICGGHPMGRDERSISGDLTQPGLNGVAGWIAVVQSYPSHGTRRSFYPSPITVEDRIESERYGPESIRGQAP